jgi:hypothetical protein
MVFQKTHRAAAADFDPHHPLAQNDGVRFAAETEIARPARRRRTPTPTENPPENAASQIAERYRWFILH